LIAWSCHFLFGPAYVIPGIEGGLYAQVIAQKPFLMVYLFSQQTDENRSVYAWIIYINAQQFVFYLHFNRILSKDI